MTAEIEKVLIVIEEGLAVLPGQKTEIDSPTGPLQIIGTERGFAVRRQGTLGNDIRYENGESLTIKYKDGTRKVITAVSPDNWSPSEILDPQL